MRASRFLTLLAHNQVAIDYYDLVENYTILDAAPLASTLIADGKGQQDASAAPASYYVDANGMQWNTILQGIAPRSTAVHNRALGRAMYHRCKVHFNGSGGDSSGTFIGFYSSDLATRESGFQLRHFTTANSTELQAIANTATTSVVTNIGNITMLDDTDHHFAVVLLTTGTLCFVKGGNFTSWTLHSIERVTSRSTVHHAIGLIGGFDANLWGATHRATYIAKPSNFWQTDFVASTAISTADATTATMESVDDGFTFAIGTIWTTGGCDIEFRRVDASNYVWIQIAPATASTVTVKLFEVIAGSATQKGSTITAVVGDAISLQRYRNTTNHFRWRNNLSASSNYQTSGSTPVGLGINIRNSGNGALVGNKVYLEPRTVSNTGLLAWLNALATGAALP